VVVELGRIVIRVLARVQGLAGVAAGAVVGVQAGVIKYDITFRQSIRAFYNRCDVG